MFSRRARCTHVNELNSQAQTRERGRAWGPLLIIALITLLAHANAFHDALVLDDKVFVGPNREAPLNSLGEAFERDVWARGPGGKLYRPLLLVVFEFEQRLFGDWVPGYHAVNVGLHTAVVMLLYGLLCMLLTRAGVGREPARFAALMSSLLFAVHPIHAEVVNSVFNGSSMYVALATILGLRWLFGRLDDRPASAWIGFGLIYTMAIFFKESALVMPGLAVALIVILGPGSLVERTRRFLPVFFLLLPIALFFYLRQVAIGSSDPGDGGIESEFAQLLESTDLPDEHRLKGVLAVLGGALRLIAWPHPLQLYYSLPTGTEWALLLVAMLALAGLALYLLWRGNPGVAAGLAFFFVAMLPASRLMGLDGAPPHLADRYLYTPSVGIAIATAFLLVAALKRFSPRPILLLLFPLVVLLALLNWQRSHEWSSQALLFETDYARGNRTAGNIRFVIGEHRLEGRYARVVEICDENSDGIRQRGMLAVECATAYFRVRRNEDGISLLESAMQDPPTRIVARTMLADIWLAMNKREEFIRLYREIVEEAETPEAKATHTGIMIARLFPENPDRLREALGYFERALELDPELEAAQKWKDHVVEQLAGEDGQQID